MKDNLRKNIIWNTVGVLTFSLTSLLYTIILMRYSTLKITGIFSFGFALACTTTALAALGGRTYQVTDVKNELSSFTYILAFPFPFFASCTKFETGEFPPDAITIELLRSNIS